jgi:cysteine desulfurase/selenocysteine lyase
LDNAATSQKPRQVIQAISQYYEHSNANVHRGVHLLGDESTTLFHESKRKIAEFFGANVEELVIVRNTTEAANQVAMTWGDQHLGVDEAILVTEMEHHSNLVPWQELAKRTGAQVHYVSVTSDGLLDLVAFEQLCQRTAKIKLFALSHVSNALGTLNPVTELIAILKKYHPSAHVFVDGAQAAPHLPINFAKLGVDFYAVSAHKMLGPMGIGGLLVRQEVLKTLSPWLVGGGMIAEVSLDQTTYADDIEDRFTAGTPDVASLVGWAAACEYLRKIGMEKIFQHDQELVAYALEKLGQIREIKIVGPLNSAHRVGSVTFVYQGVHAHDVGQILDSAGVAVRSGHHCTMPLHTKFGWAATIRASFQLYTTKSEIDALVAALAKVKKVFGL